MGGLQPALRRTTTLMWIGTIGLIGFWPLAKDAILASALAEGRDDRHDRLGRRPDRRLLHRASTQRGSCGSRSTGRRSTYADVHLHDTSHGEAPADDVLDGGGAGRRNDPVGLPRHRVRDARRARQLAALRRPHHRVDRPQRGAHDGDRRGAWAWRERSWSGGPTRARSGSRRSSARSPAVRSSPRTSSTGTPPTGGSPICRASGIAGALYRWFERWIIWGSVSLVAYVVRAFSRAATEAQNGVVRLYATAFVAGAAVLAAYFLGRASL